MGDKNTSSGSGLVRSVSRSIMSSLGAKGVRGTLHWAQYVDSGGPCNTQYPPKTFLNLNIVKSRSHVTSLLFVESFESVAKHNSITGTVGKI